METFGGKSAMVIFERYANLKYKFENKHFLEEKYYVKVVGLNTVAVQKYIREQEKKEIIS